MRNGKVKDAGIVAICIPCHTYVHHSFVMSLAGMMAETQVRTALIMSTSSVGAAKGRNQCLEGVEKLEAQGETIEWLMWLDADMIFPTSIIDGLLSRDKDIVGGSYVRRSPPHDLLGKSLTGKPEEVGTRGLVEVKALPAGAMLMRREVMRHFRKPYFRYYPNEATGEIVGEDIVFCEMARYHGYKIWMDLDLTKTLGHIGEEVFHVPVEKPRRSALIMPERGLVA